MQRILRLARNNKTIVRMEHGIGEFVVQGTSLGCVNLTSEVPPRRISQTRTKHAKQAVHLLSSTPPDTM